jgi:cytochrome c oxidase accessory protein FixG
MADPTEVFRSELYNVDESGRRVGFFPKRPKGRFYKKRTIFSTFLLLIFFGLPFIKVHGDPLFLINVFERKFILFGFTFWPQDFLLFAVVAVSFLIFVILFTAVLGRIWCGWACPQTIFLEMVYRRIEYWIEGDAPAQRRLSKASWTYDKIKKRVLKHSIFVVIAIWVSHTVLSYFIGMDDVLSYIRQSPAEQPIIFAAVVLNAGIFYAVFSWIREQACIYMCPYGRLQGVMLDKDSLVISYDFVRGEPRGKLKKKDPDPGLGDCIDCKQCVAVCPTGIDIRHGTQLECVNCTACIDACDEIMDKVDKPRGLIRYASHRQIEEGSKFRLAPRAYLYIGVIAAFIGLLSFLIATSGDMKMTLLRKPGQTYNTNAKGNVTNLYQLSVLNKTHDERTITFRLHNADGIVTVLGGKEMVLPAGGSADANIQVELPQEEIIDMSFGLEIDVLEGDKVVKTMRTTFNGPMF